MNYNELDIVTNNMTKDHFKIKWDISNWYLWNKNYIDERLHSSILLNSRIQTKNNSQEARMV